MKRIQFLNLYILATVLLNLSILLASEASKDENMFNQITMAKKIFGEDPNKDICENECQYVQKFRGYFPLDNGSHVKTDLLEFTWKFIYIYDDHLSVFKAKTQEPPKEFASEEEFLPLQTDFLNNYPLQSFVKPCDDKICTVGDFKKLIEKKHPNMKFDVPEIVTKMMAQAADNSCLMLIQDILKPENYFYVCNENKLITGQAKITIQEQQENNSFPEIKASLKWLDKEKKNMVDSWLHLDSKQVICDNNDSTIDQADKKKDLETHYNYALGKDFFKPCASTVVSLKSGVPFEGDAAQKPEDERCFTLNTKAEDDAGEVEMHREYMCIYTSADQKEELDSQQSSMVATIWVQKLNKACRQIQLQQTHDFCEKCTDPECEKTITKDHPLLQPLAQKVRAMGIEIDKVCGQAVTDQYRTQEECDTAKQEVLINQIEKTSAGNKKCMKTLAQGIEDGDVPISAGGNEVGWDPENPYRNLDDVTKDVPVPKPAPEVSPDVMTPAQKEIEKVKKELGQPIDSSPPVKNSSVKPTVEDIARAVNTFKQVLTGRSVKDLEKIPQLCEIDPKTPPINRAIGLVPFLAKFDPWLEYCGHIRDIQFALQKS